MNMHFTHGHRHWLTQPQRTLRAAFLLITVSLGVGVMGYHYFGGLAWIDALLEAAMILGGEGPIAPMHTLAVKLFASFYALYSGLVLLTSTGLLLAPWLHSLMYHSHRQAHADCSSGAPAPLHKPLNIRGDA